jgi:hypothetical protein
VQYVEETNLDCRLAASVSDEAVAATHVRMALETAKVLADDMTPDQAINLYIRSFNLPAIDAQGVFRAAMSHWAEVHPLPGEAQAEVQSPASSEADSRSRIHLTPRREYGLRVLV